MFIDSTSLLAFVLGTGTPSVPEEEWATLCAAAINAAITTKLNGAIIVTPSEAFDELTASAHIAGAEAYKRREAVFGLTGYGDVDGSAIRVARDYIDGIAPMIARYGRGPGIA